MWYLWTGPDSPFFGKDKMTNMERVLIKDKSSHKEKRNYYYSYQEDSKVIENIMKDFGLTDIKNAHIYLFRLLQQCIISTYAACLQSDFLGSAHPLSLATS